VPVAFEKSQRAARINDLGQVDDAALFQVHI
jgi:hypothetical protein